VYSFEFSSRKNTDVKTHAQQGDTKVRPLTGILTNNPVSNKPWANVPK